MLSLVTNIFIVRGLSVGDYGVFSIAMMVVGLATTFGFSWSSSSILYFGSKEKAQYGSINKTFWARNIIIFISLLVVSLLFVIFRTGINNYIGMNVSYLILIWLYVSVAENYLMNYYLAIDKQIISNLLSVTAKVIYLLLVILINLDVRTLIILNIISHASVLIYIIGINKKDVGKFEFDKQWFKELLNFSLWQLFGFSGLYLLNFGDTAVINHFLTAEDVGVYNVAFKLFNAIASFSFVISSYYAGSISRAFGVKDNNAIKSFYYKERFLIFTISTIGHLLVMIFSRPLIIALFGREYSNTVPVFIILMIGSIVKYLSVFYMLFYNSTGRHKISQTLNIFRAILNIVLNIIFIQLYGLIGVAIGTSLAGISTFLFSVFYCERKIWQLSRNIGR